MEIIFNSALIISCLIGGLGLMVYPKVSPPIRLMIVYFIFAASAELLSFCMYERGESNTGLFHLYSLVEIIILGKVFHLILNAHQLNKFYIYVYYIVIGLVILNSLFLQNFQEFNSISSTLVSVFIISFSVVFFNLLLNTSLPNAGLIALKWLIISVFLFHCVNLFVLLFSNQLLEFEIETVNGIWMTRAVLILGSKLIAFVIFIKLLFSKNNLKRKSNVR